jgi:pterin-4a-carbinolamine dehydratase
VPRWRPATDAGRGGGLPHAGTRLVAAGRRHLDRAHYRFWDFRAAFAFVARAADLAEAEGHHPDISFGWGYAVVSLRTKKIKGLHENDFIMAAKLDRIASGAGAVRQEG